MTDERDGSDGVYEAQMSLVRKDCWCELLRKPCPYHEGYADGLERGMSL